MNQHNKVFRKLTGIFDVASQPIPGMPIVEIAGGKRVLIENHQGVMAYGKERISVHVKSGKIHISGKELEICYMSQHQLIIKGSIDCVSLERGCS